MLLFRSSKGTASRSTGTTDVYIDGVKSSKRRIDLNSFLLPPTPSIYNATGALMVVLRNQLHLLGSTISADAYTFKKMHYKWDGTSWVSVSTLPIDFTSGIGIVYNNEIHIFQGTSHYKWSGSSWTSVSTLPSSIVDVVVYNNQIHIFSTSDHYRLNGSSWVSVSTLPYSFNGRAVVYNDEIHILGSNTVNENMANHYKWDGTSWVSVSTLPYLTNYRIACVFDGCIHRYGSNEYEQSGSSYALIGVTKKHYKWDGTSWTRCDDVQLYNIGNGIVYDNKLLAMTQYGDFFENIGTKLEEIINIA